MADVESATCLPASRVDLSRVSLSLSRNLTLTAVGLLCLSVMVLFGLQIRMHQPDSDRVVGNKIANQRTGNFVVESPTHGTRFALADQKGKVLALHFLLKTECPNCLKLAHDYSQLEASNPDVVHLFLKPDSTDEIKVWAANISQEGLKSLPVVYRTPGWQKNLAFLMATSFMVRPSITPHLCCSIVPVRNCSATLAKTTPTE